MQDQATIRFYSTKQPRTKTFWENMQQALTDLPGDPKPECEGFYIATYDEFIGLTLEAIGYIPEEKKNKYMYFATKKVLQCMYKNATHSQEFADEKLDQFPGGVFIDEFGAGVSGHDPLIDEAIAVLWLFSNQPTLSKVQHENPWQQLYDDAMDWQRKHAYDNPWIEIIAKRMVDF